MDIFGIGTSEIIFIVIIALIVLGPKDMQKAGKTIGKWLRNIVTSDGWKMFQQTSRELRTLPNKLMRDANNEMNQIGKDLNSATNLNNLNAPLGSQPTRLTPAATVLESKIAPPAPAETKTNESDQEKDA